TPARALLRLKNLRANPRAAVVVDDWDEDWTRLAYVLVRGPAAEVSDAAAHAAALGLLRARYPQYRAMALDDPTIHPIVRIEPASVLVWGGAAARESPAFVRRRAASAQMHGGWKKGSGAAALTREKAVRPAARR